VAGTCPAEAVGALLGGHVLFATGDFIYSLIEAGQIRLLLLLREEKAAEYPEITILKDFGYGLPVPTFICVAGPKGIPDGIVRKIEDSFTGAMKAPAFIKGMREEFRPPIVYRGSKDLGEYVANNYEFYGKILEEMGMTR